MTTTSKGRILQDDRDFFVEVIDWNGQAAVKKTPKSTTKPERIKRLENEAYGLQFLSDLVEKNQSLKLYIPKLYEATKTSIIREYIDENPVVTARMPVAEAAERLDKLAALLAGIDRIKPYGETKFVGHFDYRNIRKNFPKWTKEPLETGLITQAQIDKIDSLLKPLETYLQPSIAHGDLSPHSHAFLMPDDKIAWVDLENFTPSAARYYDVARCYVRLYSFQASTDTPKQFLKSFISYADDIENREEQLMAIMLQRTLGMQYDAWYDAQKESDDYRNRAKELLDLVLQNKLELLYR